MSLRIHLTRSDLKRPCDICRAEPYAPCTTRAADIFGGVHIDRRVNTSTGPMGALRPAPWSGRERRRASEEEIRADERAQISLSLTGWLSGLAETDPRRTGVLAVLDRLGGER